MGIEPEPVEPEAEKTEAKEPEPVEPEAEKTEAKESEGKVDITIDDEEKATD